MPEHHVRIASDDLTFSAAHFITLGEGVCESLHGHDYRVAAEVWGPLDENQCVVDFLALHGCLKDVLADLDHAVLLPTGHPSIHVDQRQDEVEATFQQLRWTFPRGDCRLLPVANTTAELLAAHIGRRLLEGLRSRGVEGLHRLRIEVEESPGHSAICDLP